MDKLDDEVRQESPLIPMFADDIPIYNKYRERQPLLERQNNSGNKTFAGIMKLKPNGIGRL